MDEKQVAVFTEIFHALDGILGEDEVDGLQIMGALLAMPDDQFEIIKGTLCDNIKATFNTTEAKISFAQMINEQGLRIEDFSDNIDNLVEAVDELIVEGVDLSDSKKDFLKFIFTAFINTMESSKMVPHRVLNVPVEICREGAQLPTYATSGSAAMDIYSPAEYTIGPGECIIIPTGLKVNLPIGYALLIQPRSGMSRKTKLRVANTPGLIDSDYHEEIGVIIENIDPPLKEAGIITFGDGRIEDANLYGSSFTIGKGERFAQMRLVEVPLVNWLPIESLGEFENDHGKGFGSTGTN